jgi:hypothetical protein
LPEVWVIVGDAASLQVDYVLAMQSLAVLSVGELATAFSARLPDVSRPDVLVMHSAVVLVCSV